MANEKRLIDANVLSDGWLLAKFLHCNGRKCLIETKRLQDIPVVDAVEVVHGRWEQAEYHGFLRCSKCKDVYIDDTWVEDGKWNFCPNCGAKVDK